MNIDIGSPNSNNGATVLVLRINVSELEGLELTAREKRMVNDLKPQSEGGKVSEYMAAYTRIARAIENQRGISAPPAQKPLIPLN